MTERRRFNDGGWLSPRTITGAGVTTIGVTRSGPYTRTLSTFGDGSMLVHGSVNAWWSWLTTSPTTFVSVTCLRTSPPSDGVSIGFAWMLSSPNVVGGTGDERSR